MNNRRILANYTETKFRKPAIDDDKETAQQAPAPLGDTAHWILQPHPPGLRARWNANANALVIRLEKRVGMRVYQQIEAISATLLNQPPMPQRTIIAWHLGFARRKMRHMIRNSATSTH